MTLNDLQQDVIIKLKMKQLLEIPTKFGAI